MPVMPLAGGQRRGSGCWKEFSWTKPWAYVGKVWDREGRAVAPGGHQERARSGERVRVRRKREPPALYEHLKMADVSGLRARRTELSQDRGSEQSEGGLAIIVVMTSRTTFEDAEDRRERGFASFPVYIEDRVVDRALAREDGACARTR